LFKKILKANGGEPQSYLDLSYAYTMEKRYDKSLSLLEFILQKNDWDKHFDQIELIAMMEIGKLLNLAQHENYPIYSFQIINNIFFVPLHFDIRIVLLWDSELTDIDLIIKNPLDETCNTLKNYNISDRALISKDYSRGFGPIEYLLKTATHGTYHIYIRILNTNKEHNITSILRIYTNFARPEKEKEKIKVITIDPKEKRNIFLGSISWNNSLT